MNNKWEIKKLEEVCDEIFAGGDVPKNRFSKIKTDELNIPIFSNGEKDKGLYGYSDVARVTKPSITISARGTIGYSEVREEKFYPVIRLIVVIPNCDILDLYYLKYVISGIDFKSSGTSIPQLTVPMVKKYEIPLPPLPEQKRIVKILDKAFAAINKAKANAEKNLQNAKELFNSYLNKIFSNPGKDWEDKKLGQVIKLEYGKPLDKTKREINGLYPVYGANGEKARSNEYYFDKKSIIVGRKGSAGELNITTEKFWPLDVTYFIIFDEKKYNLKFLFHLLSTLNLQRLAKGVKPGINRNDVYILDVQVPPLPEQKQIVQKLDALSTETKKLETIYQQKLADLDELKKSILQKAFNGELETTKAVEV